MLLRMRLHVQTHLYKVVLRFEPIGNTTQYTNGLVFATRTLDLSGCRSRRDHLAIYELTAQRARDASPVERWYTVEQITAFSGSLGACKAC